MPEPIDMTEIAQRFSIEAFDLLALFISLVPCTQFNYNGVQYKLNMTEYNERISRDRAIRHQHTINHELGISEFNNSTDIYLNSLATYEVIDEYNKVCGVYDSRTKSLQIYLKQVIVDGVIYYCDVVDRNLYTYGGMLIGILSNDESEIIRYDSQTDYM